uniref:Uncharacterized protein n=1 Tax=Romanomermis culicivorax TaxID=13658 RepID=A0A915IWE2_ROMCU
MTFVGESFDHTFDQIQLLLEVWSIVEAKLAHVFMRPSAVENVPGPEIVVRRFCNIRLTCNMNDMAFSHLGNNYSTKVIYGPLYIQNMHIIYYCRGSSKGALCDWLPCDSTNKLNYSSVVRGKLELIKKPSKYKKPIFSIMNDQLRGMCLLNMFKEVLSKPTISKLNKLSAEIANFSFSTVLNET